MIWEWDELSTRNYDFAPMPVKYSILSSGQVLMNMKLSGLCVCTANQIIPFEFSRGIRGRVEIEIPRRGDENLSTLGSSIACCLVEIEIPRRGDENTFFVSSSTFFIFVEIEIPRRGDENSTPKLS